MLPAFLLVLGTVVGPSPEALKILRDHQCARCHEVSGVKSPPLEFSCAGCHRDIALSPGDPKRTAKGHEQFGATWERFVARTREHYVHVPALAAMDRFQATWLRDWLRAPYDLRPNLGESMIRHALTDAEIDTLVRGWGARDAPVIDPAPDAARLSRGAALFEQKACTTCHLFGNATFASAPGQAFTPENPLRALAPDLRHARARLSPETLVRWIRNPRSVKPDAVMPDLAVSDDEARLLADYLRFGHLGEPSVAPARRAPPFSPGDPVPTWEEVDAQVFGINCVHCHEDLHPDRGLLGDGGPGNTGGFGFTGAGLSFESYDSLQKGARDPKGRRVSVFREGASGEPVILERLRLRYVENDRDFVLPGHDPLTIAPAPTGPRGMPLGLPALTEAQFSLVERWVRGGHPGPRAKRASR